VGFWAVLALLYWLAYFPLGMLTAIAYFQWLGFLLFITLNIGTAYFLNQARNHSRAEAYDDRLSDVKMAQAQEYIVRRWRNKIVEN
jgi:energy-coupling factor transporter transmembrane protein EcfT